MSVALPNPNIYGMIRYSTESFTPTAEEMNEARDRGQFKSAFNAGTVKNPDGSVTYDKKITLGALANNPQLYLKAQNYFAENEKAQKDAEMAKIGQERETKRQLLSAIIGNEKQYPRFKQEVLSKGYFKPEELPEQYDLSFLNYEKEKYNNLNNKKVDIEEALKDIKAKDVDSQIKTRDQQVNINKAKAARTGSGSASANQKFTQSEYAAAGFGKRLQQAGSEIYELFDNGYMGTNISDKIEGSKFFPEFAKSNNAKKFDQAKRNFINATLRRESGASIAPSEFENAGRQYFPQPNDSLEVLAQKKRNRELVTAAFLAEGRRALPSIEETYSNLTSGSNKQNQNTTPQNQNVNPNAKKPSWAK